MDTGNQLTELDCIVFLTHKSRWGMGTNLVSMLLASLCSSQGAKNLAVRVEHGDDDNLFGAFLDETVVLNSVQDSLFFLFFAPA